MQFLMPDATVSPTLQNSVSSEKTDPSAGLTPRVSSITHQTAMPNACSAWQWTSQIVVAPKPRRERARSDSVWLRIPRPSLFGRRVLTSYVTTSTFLGWNLPVEDQKKSFATVGPVPYILKT